MPDTGNTRSAALRLARVVAVTLALGTGTAARVPGPPADGLWRWHLPGDGKRIALLFTGHEFAEGGTVILNALARRGGRASFFFTGDFLRRAEFAPLVRRIVADGHYLGPHSDKHLLCCAWEDQARTLVSREAFVRDVEDNLREVARFGVARAQVTFWVPAYEWANREILSWSRDLGLRTAGIFLRGTRASADYMCDDDPKFVSSQRIVDSVLERERESGLAGAEVLMHVGAGPCRTDKLHDRLGALLDELARRGYAFERIDEFGRTGSTPNPSEWLK